MHYFALVYDLKSQYNTLRFVVIKWKTWKRLKYECIFKAVYTGCIVCCIPTSKAQHEKQLVKNYLKEIANSCIGFSYFLYCYHYVVTLNVKFLNFIYEFEHQPSVKKTSLNSDKQNRLELCLWFVCFHLWISSSNLWRVYSEANPK